MSFDGIINRKTNLSIYLKNDNKGNIYIDR